MVLLVGLEPTRACAQRIFLLLYVAIATKMFLSYHVLVTTSHLGEGKILAYVFLVL